MSLHCWHEGVFCFEWETKEWIFSFIYMGCDYTKKVLVNNYVKVVSRCYSLLPRLWYLTSNILTAPTEVFKTKKRKWLMSTIWETGSTKCTHHDYLKANSIYVYVEKSCMLIFFPGTNIEKPKSFTHGW